MRKIDRLFEIIQLLRGQRLRTAEFISEKLGVSVRTVYRDIHGLIASGIPIEGERGIGYVIRQSIELPPLHFSPLELQAIQLGINMVKAIADEEVTAAAKEVEIKIRDVLPNANRETVSPPLAHIYFESDPKTLQYLPTLRHSLEKKQVMRLRYRNETGKATSRYVWPLGLEYWGKCWTLTAWCELRQGFRVFRLDRITTCEQLERHFSAERGKTYQDYLKQLGEQH
ncbi:MAG: helix-turn-helix transcriptional regulator [Flavobacteriales bacterium]